MDNYSTSAAICPYCGHENYAADSDGLLYDEGIVEYECGDCGETFQVSAYCQWSWTTARRTGQGGGDE